MTLCFRNDDNLDINFFYKPVIAVWKNNSLILLFNNLKITSK